MIYRYFITKEDSKHGHYVQTRGTDAPSTGGGTGTEAGFKGDRYSYVKPGRTIALKLSFQR